MGKGLSPVSVWHVSVLRSLPREGKGQELFPGYHVSPAFRGRFASPGFLLSKFVSFKVSELGTSKAGGSASSQTSNVSFDWYLPTLTPIVEDLLASSPPTEASITKCPITGEEYCAEIPAFSSSESEEECSYWTEHDFPSEQISKDIVQDLLDSIPPSKVCTLVVLHVGVIPKF